MCKQKFAYVFHICRYTALVDCSPNFWRVFVFAAYNRIANVACSRRYVLFSSSSSRTEMARIRIQASWNRRLSVAHWTVHSRPLTEKQNICHVTDKNDTSDRSARTIDERIRNKRNISMWRVSLTAISINAMYVTKTSSPPFGTIPLSENHWYVLLDTYVRP
jgi:hypothetical protein